MNQPPQLKHIWELETRLHRMQGHSGKHQERKVIMAKLETLSQQIKDYKKK